MHRIDLNQEPAQHSNPVDQHRHAQFGRLLQEPMIIYHDSRGDHIVRFTHLDEVSAQFIVDANAAGGNVLFGEPTAYGIAVLGDRHVAVTMLDDKTINAMLVPVELDETSWPEPAIGMMMLTCKRGIFVDASFVSDGKVQSDGVVAIIDSPAARLYAEQVHSRTHA